MEEDTEDIDLVEAPNVVFVRAAEADAADVLAEADVEAAVVDAANAADAEDAPADVDAVSADATDAVVSERLEAGPQQLYSNLRDHTVVLTSDGARVGSEYP